MKGLGAGPPFGSGRIGADGLPEDQEDGIPLGSVLNLGARSSSSSSSSSLSGLPFGGNPWRGDDGDELFGVGITVLGGGGPPAGFGAGLGAGFGANLGDGLGLVAAQAGTSSSSSSSEPPRPLKGPYCGVRATRASTMEMSRALGAGKAEIESAKAAARIKERIVVWSK